MKRGLLLLAILATPAMADEPKAPPEPKGVTVTFTDQEVTVLTSLMDQAVRTCGLKCAGNAAFILQKFQTAKAPPKP